MYKSACPYCDQGSLFRITIRKICIDSYICDECDTVWLRYEDVRCGTGTGADYLIRWLGSIGMNYQEEFQYHEIWKWPSVTVTPGA